MSVFRGLMMRLVCLLIAFLALHAQATITITDIDGASFFTGLASNDEEGDSEVIYGGMAGSDCTDGGSNESTCSNCVASHGSDFTSACNDNRIYPTLKLKIKLTSDNTAGKAVITNSDGTVNASLASDTTGTLSAGSTHTLSVEWGNICSTILNSSIANCAGDDLASVKIGVSKDGSDNDLADSDDDSTTIQIHLRQTIDAQARACDDSALESNDGICGFEMFPGDEKVFIKSLTGASGFPSGDTLNWDKIRIYYAETSSFDDTAINHSSSFAEFEVEKNDDGSIETDTDTIGNLTNGSTYSFRIATVDRAQNVGYHSPTLRLDTSAAFHSADLHTMVPSPVSALLTDDLQCFIATAAFGHPFKNQVQTLRDFRDQVLEKFWLGRTFIDTYYFVSPKIADLISKRPWARKTVRYALLPAILLARITLDWGIFATLSIIMSGLFVLAGLVYLAVQRVRKNAPA